MRLLIVTSTLPYPPTSGGALRVNGIVEGLRRAGHSVTLLCFHDGELPAEVPAGVWIETVSPPARAATDRLRTLVLTRQPDIAGRLYSTALAQRLDTLLNENDYDLVQFEGIEMVRYLPQAQGHGTRLSFDTFNAEYALQRSIFDVDRASPRRWAMAFYSYLQIERVRRYEAAMCRAADLVLAVSEEDAELLRPLRPDGEVTVIPNGIWTDNYFSAPPLDLGSHALVFTGTMNYRPNVDASLWFAQSVFPTLRQRVPDAQLYLVGRDPHPRLDGLRAIDGVTITGTVPHVTPYLHAAAVYVAPLRMGSGTRLKLLEAMASGCAIVATTAASAGLHPKVRETMQIADTPEAMVRAISDLLRDPARRDELGRLAQVQVRRYYDWEALIPRLLAAYRE